MAQSGVYVFRKEEKGNCISPRVTTRQSERRDVVRSLGKEILVAEILVTLIITHLHKFYKEDSA